MGTEHMPSKTRRESVSRIDARPEFLGGSGHFVITYLPYYIECKLSRSLFSSSGPHAGEFALQANSLWMHRTTTLAWGERP